MILYKLIPLGLLFTFQMASGAPLSELKKMNQCLHALEGQSEGASNSLNPGTDSEFLLLNGGVGYILTETEIFKFLIQKNSQNVIVKYNDSEKNSSKYAKLGLNKGQLGSLSFDSITPDDQKAALDSRSMNTPEIQKYFTLEIIRRIQSMPSQYQNKSQIAETEKTLQICSQLESPEIQKRLLETKTYFSNFSTKKIRQYSQPSSTNSGKK